MRGIVSILLGLAFVSADAQESKEIIDKNLEAHNQELWDQLNDLQIKGKWVTADYQAYPIDILMKKPGQIRIEGWWNQKKFIQVFDGRQFWEVAPWNETSEVSEPSSMDQMLLKYAFYFGSPLGSFAQTVEFRGIESVDGAIYYAFDLVDKDYQIRCWVSQINFRVYRLQIVGLTDQSEATLQITYEKYRSLNGLLVPLAVRVQALNFDKEIVLDEIIVGAGTPDSAFDRPEGH